MEAEAHVLAIPFPLQGHLNPMVQLCTRLVSKGIRVTLLATTLVKVPEQRTVNEINIEPIPDAELEPDQDSDVIALFFKRYEASIRGSFRTIVDKYRDTGLKAVIYDSVCPWILDLVHDKGIRGAVLFTQPCAVSSVYYHVFCRSLDAPIDCDAVVRLPALPDLLGRDLPSFVYDTTSFPILYECLIGQFSTFGKADWRLFNTFDELELETIQWLSNQERIHAVGPTVPLLHGKDDYGLSLSVLSPYDDSSIKWLDEKPDRSVVYISFGSLSQLSDKLIEEVAHGLIAATGVTFLWTVRGSEQGKFPTDFKPDDYKDRGLIVDWCNQIRVLAHRAVACFVTHGGWNSILEAVCLGVPMVVLPQWGDQTMNAKMIADVWGIGLRSDSDMRKIATRDEVAALIGEVLHGERAAEIRQNVDRWKKAALEAVSEGGSSDLNLAHFANELLKI